MFYYKQVINGKIISVEAKNADSVSPSFFEATKDEYDNFVASLPEVKQQPSRDLLTEIDELKARIMVLENK